MVRVPSAAPVPRVARSIRDDLFDAGHPAPGKGAGAGVVTSVQADTVTVLVCDEEVSGVIPLGDMPPVGTVVEVEDRGDLVVIPLWFGPPTVLTMDIPNTVIVGTGIYSTVVGTYANAIATNDGDTTYLRHQVPASSALIGYNDNIRFPATDIPGTLLTTSLVVVTKGTDSRVRTSGSGAQLQLRSGPPDNVLWQWFPVFAQGPDWTEKVTPLTRDLGAGQVEVITQARIEAGTVEYNPGSAVIRDIAGAGPQAWDSWWTYIALRVTYEVAP